MSSRSGLITLVSHARVAGPPVLQPRSSNTPYTRHNPHRPAPLSFNQPSFDPAHGALRTLCSDACWTQSAAVSRSVACSVNGQQPTTTSTLTKHPAAQVYGACVSKDARTLMYVTEYMPGGDLRRALSADNDSLFRYCIRCSRADWGSRSWGRALWHKRADAAERRTQVAHAPRSFGSLRR